MTQIHSGSSDAASASASSTEPARSAPSADQSDCAGDDDVARPGSGRNRGASDSHVLRPITTGEPSVTRLEVREVFGHVPRHAAVARR